MVENYINCLDNINIAQKNGLNNCECKVSTYYDNLKNQGYRIININTEKVLIKWKTFDNK